MTEMRIITVQPPWAQAIIFAGKNVENRSRNLAGEYSGPIAIHAGKTIATLTPAQLTMLEQCDCDELEDWLSGEPILGGYIIGVVDLVDVHRGFVNGDCCGDRYGLGPHCSPWAEPGAEHLVLANPRPLSEPIPYKGALGLRRLPDETVDVILGLQRG